jgi:hypothetical protein
MRTHAARRALDAGRAWLSTAINTPRVTAKDAIGGNGPSLATSGELDLHEEIDQR